MLIPHEPLRPFVDRVEVVGAADIDEGDAIADCGMFTVFIHIFKHFIPPHNEEEVINTA